MFTQFYHRYIIHKYKATCSHIIVHGFHIKCYGYILYKTQIYHHSPHKLYISNQTFLQTFSQEGLWLFFIWWRHNLLISLIRVLGRHGGLWLLIGRDVFFNIQRFQSHFFCKLSVYYKGEMWKCSMQLVHKL